MSGAVSTDNNCMQKNDCCCSSISNLKKNYSVQVGANIRASFNV